MQLHIGIAGRARAGKDTVAQFMIDYFHSFGIQAVRVGLADKVKEIVADLYGFSHEQCHGSLKDVIDFRYGFTPRFAFQRFGTEVARQVYQDTWVNYVLDHSVDGVTIIPDVRFHNEAEAILNRGGLIIGISNPTVDQIPISHESEQYAAEIMARATYKIYNDGTLGALKFRAERAAAVLALSL